MYTIELLLKMETKPDYTKLTRLKRLQLARDRGIPKFQKLPYDELTEALESEQTFDKHSYASYKVRYNPNPDPTYARKYHNLCQAHLEEFFEDCNFGDIDGSQAGVIQAIATTYADKLYGTVTKYVSSLENLRTNLTSGTMAKEMPYTRFLESAGYNQLLQQCIMQAWYQKLAPIYAAKSDKEKAQNQETHESNFLAALAFIDKHKDCPQFYYRYAVLALSGGRRINEHFRLEATFAVVGETVFVDGLSKGKDNKASATFHAIGLTASEYVERVLEFQEDFCGTNPVRMANMLKQDWNKISDELPEIRHPHACRHWFASCHHQHAWSLVHDKLDAQFYTKSVMGHNSGSTSNRYVNYELMNLQMPPSIDLAYIKSKREYQTNGTNK